jgi:hypothetical protein
MAGFLGVALAFVCTLGASGLALRHIYHHLCNYAQPIYQRYTVRIILMVPVSVFLFLFSFLQQKTHLPCELSRAW